MKAILPQIHRPWFRSALLSAVASAVLIAPQLASAQPLQCNPCSLSFGSVTKGTSKKMLLTLKNTASTSLQVQRYNKSAPGFRVVGPPVPFTLAAGQTATVTIAFEPTATGSYSGKLWIENSKSSIGLRILLSGTGVSGTSSGALTPNPSTVNFGTVPVGSSSSQFATIKNTGTAKVTISGSSVSGTGFSRSGLAVPMTLSPGQSVTFTTKFAPTSTGTKTGKVTITSNVSTVGINLTGTGGGSGSLSVSPTSLNFGTVTVGSSKSLTAGVKASGVALVISSITGTTSEFRVSGLTLPLNLAAGQTVSFTVKFTPASSGAASANLKFTSLTGQATTLAAAGSGVAASAHSVTLNWNKSTTTSVVGYNIYRGTVSGGPYSKVNSALESGTTFTDVNVTAGKIYFYVVTAVDGGGRESSYSNQVKTTIPSP